MTVTAGASLSKTCNEDSGHDYRPRRARPDGFHRVVVLLAKGVGHCLRRLPRGEHVRLPQSGQLLVQSFLQFQLRRSGIK